MCQPSDIPGAVELNRAGVPVEDVVDVVGCCVVLNEGGEVRL